MKKIFYYFKDPFGYRHYWMLNLSDWLFNKYMRINRKIISKNNLVVVNDEQRRYVGITSNEKRLKQIYD